MSHSGTCTKTATRERRIEFIESFGKSALEDAMCEMLVLCGPDWLTDEQIEDMTRDRPGSLFHRAQRLQHPQPTIAGE